MNAAGKIRILVVDDHYFVRVGLLECLALEPDFEVVGEAADGPAALEQARRTRPQVVLVDLRLPGMGGLELITALRQAAPDARALVLSTYQGEEDVYRAFQRGARGYLLKSMEQEDLVAAVRAVQAGRTYLPPVLAERLARRLPRPDLSPREAEVLRLIVAGRSNKEIGAALQITEGTVKLHVHRVLEKLDVADRTQAATRAIESGLVSVP